QICLFASPPRGGFAHSRMKGVCGPGKGHSRRPRDAHKDWTPRSLENDRPRLLGKQENPPPPYLTSTAASINMRKKGSPADAGANVSSSPSHLPISAPCGVRN